MECTWGRKDFAEQLTKLQTLIEQETDIKRRLYLEKVLDMSNKLYYETFIDFPRPKVTAKQRLTSILDSNFMYGRYYSIVRSFFNSISDHIDTIDAISDKLEDINPDGNFDFMNTGATVVFEDTINLVRKFYKKFDPELYQYFLEVYNDREHSLRSMPLPEGETKTDGTTLFIDGVRKNFISVYETNPLNTYICTVHEYGHAIANLINPEVSYTDREDLFVEVASIFPELVALYENGFSFDTIQVLYSMYTTLVTYVNKAEYLCLHTPIINTWADNKHVMSKKFFDELEESYDMDDDCFEEALATTIEDDGIYVISYIVALELLNMYKKDKKEALELFKRFLKYPAKEDILTFVVENIPINEHSSEEAQIILSKFSKELKKRRY